MNNRQIAHPSKAYRRASGLYLVEVLVAVCMAALLAIVMGISLAGTIRTSTTTHNQVIASALAQELLDRIKNSRVYSVSYPPNGTYYVQVFSTDPAPRIYWFQGPGAQPHPLLMDVVNYTYQNESQKATKDFQWVESDSHPSHVSVTFADGLTNTTRLLTIKVVWNENTGGQRTLELTNTLGSRGVHL